jgi:DNA-binding IclR family transcriptional regulator
MSRDGLSVVEKATIILKCFIDGRTASLSFQEIFAATPMSRTTTHRLLTDLTEHGVLAQDAQRDEYRLGPVLLSLAGLGQDQASVVERALPAMERLRDQFGETIVLAELHGADVVPIRRVDGLYEMRMNQEIGRAYPAYAGGTGKVLLAHLDSEALATYLAGARLESLTRSTITSVEELRLDLTRLRRLGVAVSRGERVVGAVAVAAPIFNDAGHAECAITVSGVAARFDPDRLMIAARAVKTAADTVSRQLGFLPEPNGPTPEDLDDPNSDRYTILRDMCQTAWASEIEEMAGVAR